MQALICLLVGWSMSLSPVTDNCKGEVKDGKKTGQWHCYYEDGKIMQEGPYQDDHKNGLWKFFHTNGKVALEGNFVNDVEKGQWKVFDETGNQTDVIDYGN
jgi:antitoxin component YwqK of YwqJK toxin-antitoxin module